MKPLIVANWKMNPSSLTEVKQLFNSVVRGLRNIRNAEVVICPPFLYISNLKSQISNLKLGSQDCFWEQAGAYTGEVSPIMLKDLGCQYVIVGHSERRKYFNEIDEMVNKKIKAALKVKLNPILCIGEIQEERNQGKVESVLKREIALGLKNISAANLPKIVIAYEPIWAIGTGNSCDVEEAQKMGLFIKKIISQIYGSAVSKKIRIIYGGSVNSKNAGEYIKEAGFQGLLVGGASLDAKEFIKIVKVE